MNSSGLANSALTSALLGRMDALRAQAGVSSGVGGVSPVDDNAMVSQVLDGSNNVSHQNHSAQHGHHQNLPHHLHQNHDQHNLQLGYQVSSQQSMAPIAETFNKVSEVITKLENEVSSLNQEMSYSRHMIEFQNQKIDKLTLLLLDLIHNKDMNTIAELLQSMQAPDHYDPQDSVEDSVGDSVHDSVHDQMHDVTAAIPSLQSSGVVSVPGVVNVQGMLLDSNMDPELHLVAQAAVQAQTTTKDILDDKKNRKRGFVKTNGNVASDRMSKQQSQQVPQNQSVQQRRQAGSKDGMVGMPGLEVVNADNMAGRKKPKVAIDFLHNPMTVKEIYDEFTKGFRGQIPLRDMDSRFGKYEWRGDSRSKESKRFQRRKKLCDAIERGMAKYDKSAEEIIQYIENFRKDKSLTWVMNGNLPHDLME